jgi:hypothetical protein
MGTRPEQEQRPSRDRDTADLPHQARNREEAANNQWSIKLPWRANPLTERELPKRAKPPRTETLLPTVNSTVEDTETNVENR